MDILRRAIAPLILLTLGTLPSHPQAAGWRLPPAGARLYVVASDYRTERGQIFVVDTATGEVTGSISEGYEPDVALSKDGARLYVSSQRRGEQGGTLDVIETATGGVIATVDDPDPWPGNGSAYTSRMAVSRDGKWLFRYTLGQDAGTKVGYVKTFDTERNAFLPDRALVPACGPANLVVPAARQRLFVVCADSQDVRLLNLTPKGGLVEPEPARLKARDGKLGEHTVAFMASPNVLALVKGDGQFFRDDVVSLQTLDRGSIRRAGQTQLADETRDWLAGRQIWRQPPTLSPDGSRLYLLVNTGEDTRAVRDRVMVVDTATFRPLQMMELSRPCVSLALSRDGKLLFAVNQLDAEVLVLDAASGQELRKISGVGPRPVFALVAPD